MVPFYLNSSGQTWLITVTNPGQLTVNAVASVPSAPTAVNFVDTVTGSQYALSILPITSTLAELNLTPSTGGGVVSSISLQSPNLWFWTVTVMSGEIDVALVVLPVIYGLPVGYAGRGSKLLYSPDSVTYTPLGQMQQFEHSGSKQIIVDQTNLLSPSNATQALAVRVDHGEIEIAGLLDPQNVTYLALQQFHIANTLVYWRVRLIDGSSFTFTGFVSEFKAFGVKVLKLDVWSAKLRLSGPLVPILL